MDTEREIPVQQATKFAKTHSILESDYPKLDEIKFFETSAKDGNNVLELFQHLADFLYTRHVLGGFKARQKAKEGAKKINKKKKKKAGKKCC